MGACLPTAHLLSPCDSCFGTGKVVARTSKASLGPGSPRSHLLLPLSPMHAVSFLQRPPPPAGLAPTTRGSFCSLCPPGGNFFFPPVLISGLVHGAEHFQGLAGPVARSGAWLPASHAHVPSIILIVPHRTLETPIISISCSLAGQPSSATFIALASRQLSFPSLPFPSGS